MTVASLALVYYSTEYRTVALEHNNLRNSLKVFLNSFFRMLSVPGRSTESVLTFGSCLVDSVRVEQGGSGITISIRA